MTLSDPDICAPPVTVRRLTCSLGRRSDLSFWNLLQSSPWRVWLDSGATTLGRGSGWLGGGYRLFAWGPPLWIFTGSKGHGELHRPNKPTARFPFRNPAHILRKLLSSQTVLPRGTDVSFAGGPVGYWGYDCRRYFDSGKKPSRTMMRAPGEKTLPDFIWFLPSFWAIVDTEGTWTFLYLATDPSGDEGEVLDSWRRRAEALPVEKPPLSSQNRFRVSVKKQLLQNRKTYEEGVRHIRRYIAAGDIYQANLSHRLDFSLPRGLDAVGLFQSLRTSNPSPYASLFSFPDFSLVSCSPELLIRTKNDRIETRPIAGTRPRGRTFREDQSLAGQLLLSPKERAEHIMLVDLERNDLGRVCRPGSVIVSDRMLLEKYSHVVHIVSQVEGRLSDGRDAFDALEAVFPGGTITGCPKIRCMEILDDLEGETRGPFYGSAGWVDFRGNMELNILIRTAILRDRNMCLRVGAGIVADSVPRREYYETLHKAGALLLARGE